MSDADTGEPTPKVRLPSALKAPLIVPPVYVPLDIVNNPKNIAAALRYFIE